MSEISRASNDFEVLTTKEVLMRLRISRTKLFELKRDGSLIPGRHFFKNGRVLRFVWSSDLIEALNEQPTETQSQKNRKSKGIKRNPKRFPKKSPINLSY